MTLMTNDTRDTLLPEMYKNAVYAILIENAAKIGLLASLALTSSKQAAYY